MDKDHSGFILSGFHILIYVFTTAKKHLMCLSHLLCVFSDPNTLDPADIFQCSEHC